MLWKGGPFSNGRPAIAILLWRESSTQDAPGLRTRDGGLKIFYDRSTLPTHPVPQTLMHNDVHFIFSYIPWALSMYCVSGDVLVYAQSTGSTVHGSPR